MKTPEERIKAYVTKHSHRDPELIRCNMKQFGDPVPMSVIRQWLASNPASDDISSDEKSSKAGSARGINLSNVRVADRKPNEGLKARFYALQKGKGYPVDALALEWCFSEDTIRNQAKRLGCLKYVEVDPGQWVACILHPDTASSYES